ncbi:predicted GPI-anchored protein 58 [Panicum hallii]|uniref:predicted GPI-anchored protein 58 n=1 Tax=Panicum hallii TaxID=206008 RepID=UPI000DF4DD95|nr:predicted GPI-anchored protein 58 [Panicum hallii]
MTSTTSPSASTAARLPRKPHPTRRTSATFSPSMLTRSSPSPPLHACTATSCSSPPSRNRHRVTCAAPAPRSCSRRLTRAAPRGTAAPRPRPRRWESSRAAAPAPRRSARTPTAVPAPVTSVRLPRFFCSSTWRLPAAAAHDAESPSSNATATPAAPAALRVHVTRTSISLPEDSTALYTLVVAACSERSSAPRPETEAAATLTEPSPKQDSSLIAPPPAGPPLLAMATPGRAIQRRESGCRHAANAMHRRRGEETTERRFNWGACREVAVKGLI